MTNVIEQIQERPYMGVPDRPWKVAHAACQQLLSLWKECSSTSLKAPAEPLFWRRKRPNASKRARSTPSISSWACCEKKRASPPRHFRIPAPITPELVRSSKKRAVNDLDRVSLATVLRSHQDDHRVVCANLGGMMQTVLSIPSICSSLFSSKRTRQSRLSWLS